MLCQVPEMTNSITPTCRVVCLALVTSSSPANVRLFFVCIKGVRCRYLFFVELNDTQGLRF